MKLQELDYDKMEKWTVDQWEMHEENLVAEKKHDELQYELSIVWNYIQAEFNLDFVPDEFYVLEYKDYTCDARVIAEYRINDIVYVHVDSHCSCHGFGPWEPETFTIDEYEKFVQRRNENKKGAG